MHPRTIILIYRFHFLGGMVLGDLKKRNERNLVIGDSHHRATLLDSEVDMLLNLRDVDPATWTYTALARTFEISKSAVRMYVKGLRRCQAVADIRPVAREKPPKCRTKPLTP